MAKKQNKRQKDKDPSGIFVPAGLLIGIGVGFIIGQIPAGTLIGLGIGFLLMAIAQYRTKKK